MYLVTTTIQKIDHLSLDEAKQLALRGRGEGKRTEIVFSEERARELGLNEPMQDLTKLAN